MTAEKTYSEFIFDNMERQRPIPEIVIKVGANISALIKQKGLLHQDIADAANLDVEALRRYMKGKQIMGIDKLYRIAEALDVEIGSLYK